MTTPSTCPFHLPETAKANAPDCFYCRMIVSSVDLGYFVAWTTPEGEFTDSYVEAAGIPVTPTIDRTGEDPT